MFERLPTFMAGGKPRDQRALCVLLRNGAELYALVEVVSDHCLARRFGLVRMPTIE